MKRIALGIEYNGHGFYGWQAQQGMPTIQGHLEQAISKIANEPIRLFCAGRTDANVHALGQVVHFDTHAKRHEDAWIWGTNTHLPPSIVVRWSKHVDYSFHARFSAAARRYRYIIYNHPIRPAVLNTRVTWHFYPLDVDRMRIAANFLLGEHDFSSFRASECNAKSPIKTIADVSIERQGNFIIFEIESNAFLHHMVRNIIGSLMKVGAGVRDPSWFDEVLKGKNRRIAAETAPADGLYLIQVRYPSQYTFPPIEPMFLI